MKRTPSRRWVALLSCALLWASIGRSDAAKNDGIRRTKPWRQRLGKVHKRALPKATLAHWQIVRGELMLKSTRSLAIVAKSLSGDTRLPAHQRRAMDGDYLRALMATFESGQRVSSARQRHAAHSLAEIASKLGDIPSQDQFVAQLKAQGHPEMTTNRLRSLWSGHREILGPHLYHLRKGSGAQRNELLHEVAMTHPTHSAAKLLKIIRADSRLATWGPWTAKKLRGLTVGKVLPTKAHKEKAIAELLTDFLRRRLSVPYEDAIAELQIAHPGLTVAFANRLAKHHTELAKEILVCRSRHSQRQARILPTVSTKDARAFGLPKDALARYLSGFESPLLNSIMGEFRTFDGTFGAGEGIEPRHLRKNASPKLKAIMAAIYTQTETLSSEKKVGRRTLTLAEIERRLPEAIAELAKSSVHSQSGYRRTLHVALSQEMVHHLIRQYHVNVVEGPDTPNAFFKSRGLSWAHTSKIRQKYAPHFPDPKEIWPSEKRLQLAEELYPNRLDGTLTPGAFHRRTGIPAAQFKIVQWALPHRFRRSIAASANSVAANVTPHFDTLKGLQALSTAWRANVFTGNQTIAKFCKEHNISAPVLTRLRNEDQASFAAQEALTDGRSAPAQRLFPDIPQLLTLENAKLVGAKAMEVYREDGMVRRAQLVAAINADPLVAAKLGMPITATQYSRLRPLAPGDFPALTNGRARNKTLARRANALRAATPEISNAELARQLDGGRGQIRKSRLQQLAEQDLVQPKHKRSPRQQKSLRFEHARLLRKTLAMPGSKRPKNLKAAAKILAAQNPRLDFHYLYRIQKEFKWELFRESAYDHIRSSTAMSERLALLIRLLPPGTSKGEVSHLFDKVLRREGLRPYETTLTASVDRYIARQYGTLKEQYAKTASEIVAEYARAASTGASAEDILDAVRRDYPTLRGRKLTYYRTMWKNDATRYPALVAAGVLAKKKNTWVLDLHGRGERRVTRRYRGGWDAERAVLGPASGDPKLKAELARFSAFVRIPTRLPLLEERLAALNGDRPLEKHHCMWVTHLLGSMVPLADAYHQAGMSKENSIIIGTPYGSNPETVHALREDGFKDIRLSSDVVPKHRPQSRKSKRGRKTAAKKAGIEPARGEEGELYGTFYEEVKKAVDVMVARVKADGKSVVAIDDGGLIAKILHTHYAGKEYEHIVRKFKIVEQTTRGITDAQKFDLQSPVVDVATSEPKREVEAKFIGQSATAKVVQGLARIGQPIAKRNVVVMGGGGATGSIVAEEMARRGANVTIVEYSADAAAKMRRRRRPDGKEYTIVLADQVVRRNKAISEAHVILGTTGHTSLSFADFLNMRSGVVVASTSSKDIETDRTRLIAEASSREIVKCDNPLVRLPTIKYRLRGKTIYNLGDGWPLNFDGDVEDIPAPHIQITRALMFEAAILAASINTNDSGNRRIIPFDEAVALHDKRNPSRRRAPEGVVLSRDLKKKALAAYEETQNLPIPNPANWLTYVRDYASAFLP